MCKEQAGHAPYGVRASHYETVYYKSGWLVNNHKYGIEKDVRTRDQHRAF